MFILSCACVCACVRHYIIYNTIINSIFAFNVRTQSPWFVIDEYAYIPIYINIVARTRERIILKLLTFLFKTQRSWVRIPSPRPKITDSNPAIRYFFVACFISKQKAFSNFHHSPKYRPFFLKEYTFANRSPNLFFIVNPNTHRSQTSSTTKSPLKSAYFQPTYSCNKILVLTRETLIIPFYAPIQAV